MTTKPKPRNFRIGQPSPLRAAAERGARARAAQIDAATGGPERDAPEAEDWNRDTVAEAAQAAESDDVARAEMAGAGPAPGPDDRDRPANLSEPPLRLSPEFRVARPPLTISVRRKEDRGAAAPAGGTGNGAPDGGRAGGSADRGPSSAGPAGTGPAGQGRDAAPGGGRGPGATTGGRSVTNTRPATGTTGGTAAKAGKPDPGPTDLAAIRREDLTVRQLRLARRLAQKEGLSAETDHEAVRKLRLKGIDPFDRTTMLNAVVPDAASSVAMPEDKENVVQLPQTVEPEAVPATETAPKPPKKVAPQGLAQMGQIQAIQRDIAARRRRKLVLLAVRLVLFVGLPTLLAGLYYYRIATPLYATHTQFVIQQADAPAQSGLGGLFAGTGFATSQDSMSVQSYLLSRDAMMRLDADGGFKAHFSQEFIDPIRRLAPDASNEEAFDLYGRMVKIGYDPTEGILKMDVIAAEPEVSAAWSRNLVQYAEEQVDDLTQRLRADQMAGATESFSEAEEKMLVAQDRVMNLQEQLGVLDPAAETGSVMGQITSFETRLRQKRLELRQLLSNREPAMARVEGVRGDIARLEAMVDDLRDEITEGTGEQVSLARIAAQLRIAETELQTRTGLMQQALTQLETARIEANRQVRYLSMGVNPIAPDEPTYPRAFENTLLAFLVFSGIYLMLSLTASILREQVSS